MGRNESFEVASKRLKKLFKDHPEYKEKMSKRKTENWQDETYRNSQLVARKNSEQFQNKGTKQGETLKQTYIDNPEIIKQISNTLTQTYINNPEIIEKQKETYKERFNAEERSNRARKAVLTSRKKQGGKSSSIEKKFAQELKNRNIDYTEQVSMLEKFRVDFLINDNIIVECDGDYWHNLPNIIEKDKIRDKLLKEKGFIVYRFWEHEINENVCKCVDSINHIIF